MPLQSHPHQDSVDKKLPNKSWSIPEGVFQAVSEKLIGSTLKIQLSANDKPREFRVIASWPEITYKNTPDSVVQFGIVQLWPGKYTFAPLTEEWVKKPPFGKIFELVQDEPKKEKPPVKIWGKLKKYIWWLTAATVVWGGAWMYTTYQAYLDGQRILKHPSLTNPIPNILLYQDIKIPSWFPLSQISGEYHISLNQLYALNPQLKNEGVVESGRVKGEITLRIPKVKTVFQLTEPRTWNDISEEYGVAPEVLMRVNGNSVAIGDLIYIPTAEQVYDIERYLFGHDIEEFPLELTADSTLEQIALSQQIPIELRDMFYEMNLASPNDNRIDAVRDIHTTILKGWTCLIPVKRQIKIQIGPQKRPIYDEHVIWENDTVDSILKYYGISPQTFQELNPAIPLNSQLKVESKVRLRNTAQVLAHQSPLILKPAELSDEIVHFVFKMETAYDFDKVDQWANKFWGFRPWLTATKKEPKLVTTGKGKNKKVTKVYEFIYPNDGPTFDPGCDLWKMEEKYIQYAFETVVTPEILARILEFARYAKKYATEKIDGKTRGHALKEIPPQFNDIAQLHLSPSQTQIVSRRAMQAYYDNYVKIDIPHIDEPWFASDKIKAGILSKYYHQGQNHFKNIPGALDLLRTGDWLNPETLALIAESKWPQSAMVTRAKSELSIYREGIDDMRLGHIDSKLALQQRTAQEWEKLSPAEYGLSKDIIERYKKLRWKEYKFGKFDCQIFLRALLKNVIDAAPELQIGAPGDPLWYDGMGERIAASLSIVPPDNTLSKDWLAPYGSWTNMLTQCHNHGHENGLQYHVEWGFMQIKIDKNNTENHTAQVLATFSHNLREWEIAIFAESGVYSEKTKDGKTRGFGHTGLIRKEAWKLSFYNAGLIENGIPAGSENGIMESGWEDLKTDLEAKIGKSDAVVLTFAKIRPDLISRAFPQKWQ